MLAHTNPLAVILKLTFAFAFASTLRTKGPGIVGFNIDLETHEGTAEDADDFVSFLTTVTQTLNTAQHGPYRFSVDVNCIASSQTQTGLISNCTALAASGVNKVWHCKQAPTSLAPRLPLFFLQLFFFLPPPLP